MGEISTKPMVKIRVRITAMDSDKGDNALE
jgi:hypothetical protein